MLSEANGGGSFVNVVTPAQIRGGPTFASMNFLNEAMQMFPDAISFAAGRPPDTFINAENTTYWLGRYHQHRTAGCSDPRFWQALGQYSETSGIIRDLVSAYLEIDEDFQVSPEECIITNGFQEALTIVLLHMARSGASVVTTDPSYVGLTGAAMFAGTPIITVGAPRRLADSLDEACAIGRARGLSPRLVYVIPDFANPSGDVMDVNERIRLLEVARRLDLVVCEDAAYRLFTFHNQRLPSLASLDEDGRVIHIGTFSKMFLPGVRIGFAALPSRNGKLRVPSAHDLSAVKSFTSVTTSPIAQAIVGGFLLSVDFSVSAWNEARIRWCCTNRNLMLKALEAAFGLDGPVGWTKPQGGFFITLTLPFEFGAEELTLLARQHGVIVMPMSFMSPNGFYTNQVRLAYSNVEPALIKEGITRIANFIDQRCRSANMPAEASSETPVGLD